MRVDPALAGPVGLLGKAPCQADFLKLNASDPLAQALHRWLEEGHEALKRAGGKLPAGATGFLFTAPGARNVLLGALQPSTDRVGRSFPLVAFTALDAAATARSFPALPETAASFLRAAAELLALAATASAAELGAALSELRPPQSTDLARAEAHRRQALQASVGEVATLFPVPGGHYYAVNTLLTACLAERGKELARAGVTLDCPTRASLGPGVWLDLAQRLLRWSSAPSLLWTLGPGEGRLLLTLGPASPFALQYLANPAHPGSKLWPLTTQKAPAIESAQKALSAAQRSALDGGPTLEAAWNALAG